MDGIDGVRSEIGHVKGDREMTGTNDAVPGGMIVWIGEGVCGYRAFHKRDIFHFLPIRCSTVGYRRPMVVIHFP